MSKNQKREFIVIILLLISFVIFIIDFLNNFSLFGDSSLSFMGIISFIFLIVLSLTFIIIYIIKVKDEKNKYIKYLFAFFPIIAVLFSYIFVNGVFSFEFLFLNILSIILEFIRIILYNIFILFYYGKNKTIVTLVLYNLIVIFISIKGTGINYIHHYYIGYLLVAILFGYIELIIKNKLKKK